MDELKQVVQPLSGGRVNVIEVPRPQGGPTEVLVQTRASLISPGTERSVTKVARSSLISKARARPDLVRQVIKKAKTEGVSSTARSVRSRLDEYLPLGYSAAGMALEVGEHVPGVLPGQRVATGGAGKANHAEFQAVPGLLCVPVPEGVTDKQASFATLASIAMHGMRLADLQVGSNVVVIGLGLVGQLTARLALAAGHRVFGIDVRDFPIPFARSVGAEAIIERGEDTTNEILAWSNGAGADAILVTAGDRSSDAIMRTPRISRDRATVVVVGNVGLNLERTPFYEKELTIRFARSYGPGRYENSYEDLAVDYSPGHVRWTEGRNLEAVLGLMGDGHLHVDDLTTHTFSIADAASAYALIERGDEPYLGIALTYPRENAAAPLIRVNAPRTADRPGVGLIGAGNFARSVLVPSMKSAGFERFVSVSSASGLTARRLAEKAGFENVAQDAAAVIEDPDVEVVVIATPHDTHADLTVRALRADKNVFCEKPLALTMEELDQIETALEASSGLLFVGYNRRWSTPVRIIKEFLGESAGPLTIAYKVNAGEVPESHWYNDRRQGGRLIGEVCHFIDTCNAIVDLPAVQVHAVGSGGERLLASNIVLSLAYEDGSVASIVYASSGHDRTAKEQLDVLGRGRTASLIDFSQVILNSKSRSVRPQDKGHVMLMRTVLKALEEGGSEDYSFVDSARLTLMAADCLRNGRASEVQTSALHRR